MERTRNRRSRATIRENRRLGWYAAVWDEPTVVYDFRPGEKERSNYTEVVRPGSFADSLRGSGEVLATIDHDPTQTFARRSDETLLLQEDGYGLYASCWLPDDDLGNAILTEVEGGRLDGASFRFVSNRERWTGDTCELLSVVLHDVCLTDKPAYPSTKGEVHLRTQSRLAELFARLRLVKMKMRI